MQQPDGIIKEKQKEITTTSTFDDLEASKISFVLHLADNALILAQQNTKWCGHGPVLEQDIALTNISLDLLGQSRNLYQYAASLINKNNQQKEGDFLPATEDSLAYFRDEKDFKNCLLVEQPNGNWGQTILRQFLFSHYQYLLYQQLQFSKDETLAAIAVKSLKEITYHIRWSSEWVIRLGDGTEESHQKMVNALGELWAFTGEFFMPADYEIEAIIGTDLRSLKQPWFKIVREVLEEATLWTTTLADTEQQDNLMQSGGKNGVHSEYMGYILAELQYLQRVYPGSEW